MYAHVLSVDREALVRSVNALPSLPAVVIELMTLVHQHHANLEPVAHTLALDQALSAKVLRLANSPFYGVPGRIDSIRDGVQMLGMRQLSNLVLAASLTLEFEKRYGITLHMRNFWRHSIGCAVAARHVAATTGHDTSTAFTAGLLHDMGRLVAESHYPDAMAEAQEWAMAQDIPTAAAEEAMLGIGHAELGAMVAKHWHFTNDVIHAIAHHHQPPSATQATLADVVHAANAMAHALDLAGTPTEAVPMQDSGAWQRLNISDASLQTLFADIETEFAELMARLHPTSEAL